MGIPRSSTNCTSNPCFSKKPFLAPTQSGLYPRVLLDAPKKILGFSCAMAQGGAKVQTSSANAIRRWITMRPPRASASFLLQNRVASNLFNRGALAIKTRIGNRGIAENPRGGVFEIIGYWHAIASIVDLG